MVRVGKVIEKVAVVNTVDPHYRPRRGISAATPAWVGTNTCTGARTLNPTFKKHAGLIFTYIVLMSARMSNDLHTRT